MNSIYDSTTQYLPTCIYEDINKEYGYGNYLGLKVIIHK